MAIFLELQVAVFHVSLRLPACAVCVISLLGISQLLGPYSCQHAAANGASVLFCMAKANRPRRAKTTQLPPLTALLTSQPILRRNDKPFRFSTTRRIFVVSPFRFPGCRVFSLSILWWLPDFVLFLISSRFGSSRCNPTLFYIWLSVYLFISLMVCRSYFPTLHVARTGYRGMEKDNPTASGPRK